MHRLVVCAVLCGIVGYAQFVIGSEPIGGQQCTQFEYDRKLLERLLHVEMELEPCCQKTEELEAEVLKLRGELASLEKEVDSQRADTAQNFVRRSPVESEGWKLVFRATAGNGDSVYRAWTAGTAVTLIKPTTMKRSNERHFRDPIVGKWPSVNRVKYSIFRNEIEVAYVIFNGAGCTRDGWFDKSRVLESSWSDVTAAGDFNFFSLKGDERERGVRRPFIINKLYAGCPGDVGYTMAIDVGSTACDMDNYAVYPQFLYSQINGPELWNLKLFGRADYAAVYVEY